MDKTIEQQIAELWPDKCPKCNSPAWIGAFQVTCVSKSCSNGSEKEFEKYAKLLSKQIDDLIEQTPNPTLDMVGDGQLWVDSTQGQITFVSGGGGSGIDEDDEDTQPGLAAPRSFKWFDDLDSKVELALRPYGKARVSRCEYEDAFEVILYNPPTGLYISEKFTVEFAEDVAAGTGDRGFGDWMCRHLLDTFPRELDSAWGYKQVEQTFNSIVTDHLADPPDTIQTGAALQFWFDGPHTLQAPEGMTRALKIGQYMMEYRVTAIDRCNDTFTISKHRPLKREYKGEWVRP